VIQSVDAADSALTRSLPRDFAKLRAALKPMVGGDLARVVFVSYGHPALRTDGSPCASGQTGFDVHPSFKLDGERLRQVSGFVGARFLPQIKAIAQCGAGSGCLSATDRFTFVDAPAGSIRRTRRVRAPRRPNWIAPASVTARALRQVGGARPRLTCGQWSRSFVPMRRAARWIRTANDSYFVAMTYPEGLPLTQQPSDIHDATWGVISAVYGGAVHPTAEGHAAMADAALPAARSVLGLATQGTVTVTPLGPLNTVPQ
jgi:hypothetical protein